jgi:hypothetical protein
MKYIIAAVERNAPIDTKIGSIIAVLVETLTGDGG